MELFVHSFYVLSLAKSRKLLTLARSNHLFMGGLVVCLCVVLGAIPLRAENFAVRVARVVDADTFVLETAGLRVKARLFGVDAPEYHSWAGRRAAVYVRLWIEGRTLLCRDHGFGSWNRLLVSCSIDGMDVANRLLSVGLAAPWGK